MRLPLFALLLLTAYAVAAPVPKLGGVKKIEDVYGPSVEIPGVTLQMTRRDELKASVGKDAAAGINANRITGTFRPLAAKTVAGDFELTVRVTHAPPAKADLAVGTGSPTVIAGLALFAEHNPKSTASFFHEHVRAGDTWKTHLNMSTYHPRGGSGSGRQGGKLEDKPVYLRLTRTGDEFKSETSADGKKWQAFATHKASGFGAVVVGPYAGHNPNGEYEVTFDEYVLKTPEEKK